MTIAKLRERLRRLTPEQDSWLVGIDKALTLVAFDPADPRDRTTLDFEPSGLVDVLNDYLKRSKGEPR